MRGTLISMWSGPRNISTATMYAFRSRPDTVVVDEPLYAHYLTATGLDHPGRNQVLASQNTDGRAVVRDVLLAETPADRPVRFIKNMAHHYVDLDPGFLDQLTNILLTRDPAEMLVSLTKVLPDADVDETGLPGQIAILDEVLTAGQDPIVLDARLVLENPAGVLEELCDRVGIPFTSAMLSWPAGPKPEDGVWARHWYANVHASTGFGTYRPPTEPFPERLRPLLEECVPLYERLAERALTGR